MSQEAEKTIGLLIGEEWEWAEAFMKAVNESDANVSAELVKIAEIRADDPCEYDIIIDRISHLIPYYRSFLKFATLQECHIINNPFTWSADSRFFGNALVHKLGLRTPRTVILPNKYIEQDVGPDTFRNLKYPMDWEGIIDYVGVPAIFKGNYYIGGRQITHRVHNVDELIRWYDESGTSAKILQQIIESETHIHSIVIGQESVISLRYSLKDGRYLPDILSNEIGLGKQLTEYALKLTRAYQYDINMVEFVIENDVLYVINGNNPAPEITRSLMTDEQFDWCVQKTATLAINRAQNPPPPQTISAHLD